jgi:hypothetical protein
LLALESDLLTSAPFPFSLANPSTLLFPPSKLPNADMRFFVFEGVRAWVGFSCCCWAKEDVVGVVAGMVWPPEVEEERWEEVVEDLGGRGRS